MVCIGHPSGRFGGRICGAALWNFMGGTRAAARSMPVRLKARAHLAHWPIGLAPDATSAVP